MLGIVSLFTDMASEMLYPVMPAYLRSIGFSVLLIGILEGFVEMVAGLGKGYFGKLSDVRKRRLPFIRGGYGLSALSKPLLAVSAFPPWVFFARTLDRLGKGLRTAPRDAMLSGQTTAQYKARVFGFHRGMDTLGAVLGPAMALLFLALRPADYRMLFLIAFLPGMAAVYVTFRLREKREPFVPHEKVRFFAFTGYVRTAPAAYRKLLAGLILFALVNSSDVLLLLRMKTSGLSDTAVIGVYIIYNLAYAVFALPAGAIADRFGIRNVFIGGLLVFAMVYGGFALTDSFGIFIGLFLLYGIYAACTEGIAKAWITNLVPKDEAATATGTFAAFSSLAALPASTLTALIWDTANAEIAFGVSAIVAVLLTFYFLRLQKGNL